MNAEEAARNLATIREVIDRSRAERARSGDIYLVYGVVVVLADAITVGSGALLDWQYGWLAFPILAPVAVAYAAIVSRRRSLEMSTFGFRIEGRLWMFTSLAFGAVFAAGAWDGLLGLRAIVPLICAAIGVAMGTSGALFASRGMTASGLMFVAVAGGSCLLPLTAQHLLFMAAVLAGYVVPGALWLRDERRRLAALAAERAARDA